MNEQQLKLKNLQAEISECVYITAELTELINLVQINRYYSEPSFGHILHKSFVEAIYHEPERGSFRKNEEGNVL
jgi:hypothetical protein